MRRPERLRAHPYVRFGRFSSMWSACLSVRDSGCPHPYCRASPEEMLPEECVA